MHISILFSIICLFFHTTYCFHVLHLTFHKGCQQDIEYVARMCNIELTTLFIPDMQPYSFDPQSHGNVLYNMGKNRADRIFNNLSDYFNQFDAILTSDTTPLSRIFLQNHWKKPLIIWICNRFDYADYASLDCEFPDEDYYTLIRNATNMPNVRIISYTPFEHYYAQTKDVNLENNITIRPCKEVELLPSCISSISSDVCKEKTFFIPPYHNDTQFIDLKKICATLNISVYGGRYNGPQDLQGFKGIIHIPYTWSTLAFFENMQLGIPYLIPSYTFLKQLIEESDNNNFFHPQAHLFLNSKVYQLSEWYNGQYPIIYFDSWHDLQEKIKKTDFNAISNQVKIYAKMHRSNMIEQWKKIFTWSKQYVM